MQPMFLAMQVIPWWVTEPKVPGEISSEMLIKAIEMQGKRPFKDPSAPELTTILRKVTHLHLNGLSIAQLSNKLTSCLKLEVLYLYDNHISEMPDFKRFTNLTHLNLQNNFIVEMKGLEMLENLQKLYLQGNCIQASRCYLTTVFICLTSSFFLCLAPGLDAPCFLLLPCQRPPDISSGWRPRADHPILTPYTHWSEPPWAAWFRLFAVIDQKACWSAITTALRCCCCLVQVVEGLSKCTRLQELHLSGQKIRRHQSMQFDLASLHAIGRTLTVLTAADCVLRDLEELSLLGNLRRLDVSNNDIREVLCLEPMLEGCSRLEALEVRGNPVCKVRGGKQSKREKERGGRRVLRR